MAWGSNKKFCLQTECSKGQGEQMHWKGDLWRLSQEAWRSWGYSQDDEKRSDSNSCIESAGTVTRQRSVSKKLWPSICISLNLLKWGWWWVLNPKLSEGQAREVLKGTKGLAGGMDRKIYLKDMRERKREPDRDRMMRPLEVAYNATWGLFSNGVREIFLAKRLALFRGSWKKWTTEA